MSRPAGSPGSLRRCSICSAIDRSGSNGWPSCCPKSTVSPASTRFRWTRWQETLYAAAGNPATAEWTDLAARLFAGRGIALAESFPEIDGEEEFARVIRKRRWSVLASTVFIGVPGMVLRSLVEPVPLSPISLVWRKSLRHPGLSALHQAIDEGVASHGWLDMPAGAWLPAVDMAMCGQIRGRYEQL